MGKHHLGRFGARSGRSRRAVVLAAASLLVVGTGVFSAQPSFAVHDTGQFELDGNIANNGNAVYDWGNLFNAGGGQSVIPDPNNGPLLASDFNADAADPDKTYFTSNKDIEPVANWGCTTLNNPTPKDDLQNAYAALVQIPANAPDNAGHKVLYLGSERQTNNGDSFAGFWLMKNKSVGCSGSGSFSGTHTDGDILVLSNYTNGGGTQDVQVYRWTGNDATGAPVAVPGLSGSKCGTAAADSACAIANTGTITSPWSPTSHDSNTFVEAGIDLNNLLDATGGGCFTNFLAESRSSQQITATLKDFAAGQFNTCPPAPITTAATPGGSTVARGTSEHDVATLTAVGGRPAPSGTVSFFLCQPADVTAAGCPTGGTQVGSAVTVANGSATSASTTATTADGKYCWRAEYTPDASGALSYLASSHTNATTECFTVVHASPTLTTQIATTNASGALGLTTLTDTATLHGFLAPVTGESVAFNLYGPFAAGVTPTCDSTAVFSTTGTLDAQGVATTVAGYTPTQVGTYVWRATYAGDPYNGSASDACNETTEKITVVGATIDVTKSADLGTVSAGDTIGFTITAENKGSIPALGTVITDTLPAGADLNWTIDPTVSGCSIGGPVGSQKLTCTVGTLAGNSTFPVHISSPTTKADCGVVNNKATVTTTNGTGGDSDTASITVNCAQLSLTKTADAASVNAGSPIGFTVTASNSSSAGTGTAHGVTISDPLPTGSGINWSIDTQTSNKCSIAGTAPGVQTVNCTLGDVAPGATYSFHVTSSTAYASCGDYKNVATLSATNANSIEKTASTSVLCSSLSLTKTADHKGPVDAGSQIGFTITAGNTGSGSATGVVIGDTLPAGVTWSIESGPANCSIAAGPPQVLTCTAVTLAEGQTESVHIVASTTYSDCAAYENTATLTSTNSPSPAPATATETVNCPDLTLTKVADAETVDAGTSIGFTVTVSNSASAKGTATGVVVNDALPSGNGISWSVDTQSGKADCTVTGTVPTQSLTCASVSLAPGESESVHVTSATTYISCQLYSNTATLTATSNHPGATASASTTVQCPTLSITKTADASSVSAGEDIGFTVTVTNAGPGTATDVALDDPLPGTPGLDWTMDSGPENCSVVTDAQTGKESLVCDPSNLAAESSLSVHVTAQTVLTDCATYDNTATFTATNAPGGEASASTSVLCPDVSLVKSADATSVNAGESIGFSITVSNSDSENVGTATGVTVHDALPGGSGVVWSIDSQSTAGESSDNCSLSGDAPDQVLDCSGVTLAPGESETVHVTSVTTFASCKTYDNTASAAVVNGVNPEDASASVDVLCAGLAVSKTADAASVSIGNPIGFTIHASNSGPGTAKNVTLTDKLPAGVDANWSVNPAYEGPGTCSITGSVGSQTLSCALGDLAPEDTAEVHVVSATSDVSCATLPNTVVLDAANAPSLSAAATTTVTDVNNCLGVSPSSSVRPPTTPVPSTSSGVEPVAVTGAGPLGAEIGWAAVLLGLGIGLLALARRRRSGGNHAR